MNFKAGQRVRIVAADARRDWIGLEAIITSVLTNARTWTANQADIVTIPLGYRIAVNGIGERHPDGNWIVALPHQLAPLTDPGADAFLERIRKLWREPRVEPRKEFEIGTEQ